MDSNSREELHPWLLCLGNCSFQVLSQVQLTRYIIIFHTLNTCGRKYRDPVQASSQQMQCPYKEQVTEVQGFFIYKNGYKATFCCCKEKLVMWNKINIQNSSYTGSNHVSFPQIVIVMTTLSI